MDSITEKIYNLINENEFISSKMKEMNDKILKKYDAEIRYMKNTYGNRVHICTSYDLDIRSIPKLYEDPYIINYNGLSVIKLIEFINKNPEYSFPYWKKIFKCIVPKLFFVIKYEDVTVSNEEDNSLFLGDLLCTFYIQDNMIPYKHEDGTVRCDLRTSNLYLSRLSYTAEHFYMRFSHPHCKPLKVEKQLSYFSYCCLGRGPLHELIMNFNSEVMIDTFELVMLYSANIDSYVSIESLKGGPYIKISTAKSYSFDDEQSATQRYIQTPIEYNMDTSGYSSIYNFISEHPMFLYMFIDSVISSNIYKPRILSSKEMSSFLDKKNMTFMKFNSINDYMMIKISELLNECIMSYCLSMNKNHCDFIKDLLRYDIIKTVVIKDDHICILSRTNYDMERIINDIKANNGTEIIKFNGEPLIASISMPKESDNNIKYTYVATKQFASIVMYNIAKNYM